MVVGVTVVFRGGGRIVLVIDRGMLPFRFDRALANLLLNVWTVRSVVDLRPWCVLLQFSSLVCRISKGWNFKEIC